MRAAKQLAPSMLARAAARARPARGAATAAQDRADVTIVGCGTPNRSMGWYHGVQLLRGEVPSGRLVGVVEPFLLSSKGASLPAAAEFRRWMGEQETLRGVHFAASVADAPAPRGDRALAVVAGRAAENPQLVRELVSRGWGYILLEKPGATSAEELAELRDYCDNNGVQVFMGYNKNVAQYVQAARQAEAAVPGALTTFVHNNQYDESTLQECFERNSEGMLKNMICHELALCVTYYGITPETLQSVQVDRHFSRCLCIGGITDFSRLGFIMQTHDGRRVAIRADRCGGATSEALVTGPDGSLVSRTVLPDEETYQKVLRVTTEKPLLMPYLACQDAEYRVVKERICAHILSGGSGAPEGVATLDIGVETLRLCDHLTPLLQAQLLGEVRITFEREGRYAAAA